LPQPVCIHIIHPLQRRVSALWKRTGVHIYAYVYIYTYIFIMHISFIAPASMYSYNTPFTASSQSAVPEARSGHVMCRYRPRSLLEAGFRPRVPLLFDLCHQLQNSLICTISSEIASTFIFTHLSEPVLTSAGFQWTGSTPAGFQEAFPAARGRDVSIQRLAKSYSEKDMFLRKLTAELFYFLRSNVE